MHVDLVVVSPLYRALATASLAFGGAVGSGAPTGGGTPPSPPMLMAQQAAGEEGGNGEAAMPSVSAVGAPAFIAHELCRCVAPSLLLLPPSMLLLPPSMLLLPPSMLLLPPSLLLLPPSMLLLPPCCCCCLPLCYCCLPAAAAAHYVAWAFRHLTPWSSRSIGRIPGQLAVVL